MGGLFGFGLTVMLNGASDAVAVPSDTEIVTLAKVAAEPAGGVPLSRPELAVNVAHAGRLAMLKVSALPSGSLAVGTKP